MQGLVVGDLRIEAVENEAASALQLLWTGKSNNRHLGEALAPLFREAQAIARAKQLPIELHFENLEHCNSSTITSIIQLIQDARTRGVKLIMVYDHGLKWQKLSFDALRVFARDELLELRSA